MAGFLIHIFGAVGFRFFLKFECRKSPRLIYCRMAVVLGIPCANCNRQQNGRNDESFTNCKINRNEHLLSGFNNIT